jgi:RadC-like JAB domain
VIGVKTAKLGNQLLSHPIRKDLLSRIGRAASSDGGNQWRCVPSSPRFTPRRFTIHGSRRTGRYLVGRRSAYALTRVLGRHRQGRVRASSSNDCTWASNIVASADIGTIGSTGFTSPRVTADYLRVRLASSEREISCVIYLTRRHQFIACEDPFRSMIDGASVYPREVLIEAFKRNAAVILNPSISSSYLCEACLQGVARTIHLARSAEHYLSDEVRSGLFTERRLHLARYLSFPDAAGPIQTSEVPTNTLTTRQSIACSQHWPYGAFPAGICCSSI